MDQDWDYYKDLIDAVSLFVLCRIKSETLSRQYRRLRHILGSPPNPPLFPSSLDKFRSSLEVTVRTKRDRVSRTSTENLILSQAISLLDNESAGPEAEYDPLSAMMKAGFLGSEFMVLLHKLASFERGSPWSAQDVEQLKQLGKSLYGAVNRIDDRFGVIPYPGGEFFDETSLLMPTVLICGLRDSQFGSQSFIDLSFLWNWMAFASPGGPADLPTGLFREKDIQVLIETVVASEQWDLNRQESHHDHTFWHVVLLARRPGDSQVIHYDGKPILTTKWGKNILHYAAATGVKLEVKASGGWAGSRD
ncbi:hypothetical protein B0T16DRAFT_457057 [Cercophora newfieldiana]|uniref:Uncharacterized protein n=1 Tax=Cercophora newfieldiana TaxID=92897 RepID=A0AA39YBN6_9PEZI|nr:hypothetical protein B0T16DRAFT_457057 [Cercophora newfieldiana]